MLKTLRRGSTGALVQQWQVFLRGQGLLRTDTSDNFDQATEDATKAFQSKHRLLADGVVGNQTIGKAAQLGFEIVDLDNTEFPTKPTFPPLVNNQQRQALFGPLAFEPKPTASNPEAIRITNGWDRENIVVVTIPQLIGKAGANPQGRVSFHRKAAAQLTALWQAWEDAGLLPLVLSYQGSYVPRFIRGGAAQQILSNHAFGTAFDINADRNPLGAEPAAPDQPGCVYRLVPIAHQHGFYWGGHFSRRDGMHFEVAKIL